MLTKIYDVNNEFTIFYHLLGQKKSCEKMLYINDKMDRNRKFQKPSS